MTRTVIEYHEQPRESVTMQMEPQRWEPDREKLELRPTHSKVKKICKYIRDIAKAKRYDKGNWRFSPYMPKNQNILKYGDIA
jgi:hypothetical protein